MTITLQEAKELQQGTILHSTVKGELNADNTPIRWKVNGKPKVWKRSPEKVKVPLKHGLYVYGYLTELNLDCVEFPQTSKEKRKEKAHEQPEVFKPSL